MKIVVNGQTLDLLRDHLVGDLRLLEREYGFGYGTAIRRITKIDATADVLELLDDHEAFEALLALIWLARLGKGERDLTREEVDRMPIGALTILDDAPSREVDDSVPTSAPTDSVRGVAAAAPARSKKGSTSRSKRPSTAA